MDKTLQKPLACRNAHCGAMCSPASASFSGGNPEKCFDYERRDDLYQNGEIIMEKDERIKKLEKENKALKNRCYVLSSGAMCLFCPMDCEHRSSEFRNANNKEEI